MFCSRLIYVHLRGSGKLNGLAYLPKSVEILDVSCSDIERIPDCIKALHQLDILNLGDCRRLTSLPKLPGLVKILNAENCESLETVFFPLSSPNAEINFTNCVKLGQQARRGIIRRSFCNKTTLLPGREVPAEFDNRAKGGSLTIVLEGNKSYNGFVFCVVFSPNQRFTENGYSDKSWLRILSQDDGYSDILWRHIIAQEDGYPVEGIVTVGEVYKCQTEHLFIFHYRFREFYRPKVNREMMFEFSCKSRYLEIIECGAKIVTEEESIEWSYESGSDQADILFEPSEEASEEDIEGEKNRHIVGVGSSSASIHE